MGIRSIRSQLEIRLALGRAFAGGNIAAATEQDCTAENYCVLALARMKLTGHETAPFNIVVPWSSVPANAPSPGTIALRLRSEANRPLARTLDRSCRRHRAGRCTARHARTLEGL